ncbi:TlpA family protein disulfide reductase [Candidatus Nitrosacidococcus tergens]|uniref:Alkyl hydroperoxide reductase/ Thiol specific antioxidant/ Mal allergen n=1 Tax=Candidatus Nitrosacidococcus tergens TaxID=553981 RepID=A0A7G1QBD4_9GAMM|nr:TlpA disulfide reductase family protein [Candidatus Nitrosacidococcus tergens]CAB1277191.1 Alkyl hydroperoxide reductase/ Thiol specific antioxidant/ Mal allergen [Candidatus Nitrosacidococcus tergens]
MNQIARWPLLLVVALVAGISGYIVNQLHQGKEQSVMIGTYRPDFQLPDVNGIQHNISEWDRQVIIVNFWATWCPPCLREIPNFIELQKSLGNKGLQFIGVAIDKIESVKPFVKEHNINYPILIDEGADAIVSKNYGNSLDVVPYTVVIDQNGKIIYTHAGELDKKTIEGVVLPLL